MRLAMSFILAACLSQAAHAGPLEDLADAQQKMLEAWHKVPLTARKVLFATEPSNGYGIYEEKTSNVFKPTEKIFTHVELLGYDWKTLPTGLHEMNFVTDLAVKTESGDVAADQKAFSTNVLQSHELNAEFSMDFTLTLTNVPPGKYTVEYTIHDMTSQQQTTIDQDIVVAD